MWIGDILCQGQVEKQMTSGAVLFRTLNSSVIWMEFINIMIFLVSYFCTLTALTIEGTMSILANSSHRLPNFRVHLILRQWACKALSYERWARHHWIAAVPLCSHKQLWTITLYGLPVDLQHDIPSLAIFSSSVFPERRIQPQSGQICKSIPLFCDRVSCLYA